MPQTPKNKLAYFIGIGGIGISALARWYQAHGFLIKGSDLSPSSTIKELANEGADIKIGPHNAKNLPTETACVIYNQAIPATNPELQKARELKIPVFSYPERLGELTRMYKTIAIAGAHGKSTTTSLVSLILEKAGLDPTVIVGTKLKEFGNRNFKNGKGDYLVIEADEWKASFLNYFPYATLITNIDREHLDFYKNLGDIKRTFLRFINNVHPYGLVVLNKDNKNLLSLKERIKKPIVWYSTNSKDANVIKKILKIPGVHNLSNAVGAYALARALGVKKEPILKALASYSGAWRRSELRGKIFGAEIFDDYGHHPTEIKTTLAGFKEKYRDHKIICVFQPHQRKRLKLLFRDFTKAFGSADELVLLEIYGVAGRDEEKDPISAAHLASAIQKETKKTVSVVTNISELKSILKEKITTSPKTIIIMMGAGNINEWTDSLLNK